MRGDNLGRLWTEEEDDLLRDLYPLEIPAVRIAEMMDRTEQSVLTRAGRLGIRRFSLFKKYGNIGDEWIEAVCQPHTLGDLADEFGCRLSKVVDIKKVLKKRGYPVVDASEMSKEVYKSISTIPRDIICKHGKNEDYCPECENARRAKVYQDGERKGRKVTGSKYAYLNSLR